MAGLPQGVTGPGRPRGTLALAAAVGVVVGVHDGAADGGSPAHVALPATGVTGIFGILLHLHMPLQYIIMMAISLRRVLRRDLGHLEP